MNKNNISTLPFLKENTWQIILSKIPLYPDFEGEFIEPLDINILKMLHECDDVRIGREVKSLLKNALLDNIDQKTGDLRVVHHNRHGLGRYYPDNDTSIIPHSKFIKHTTFAYLGWSDIDMIKGHPTIGVEMAKSIGLKLVAFENYIENFDTIAEELIQFYTDDNNDTGTSLDKGDIKWLFVLMIYGGGFSTWKRGVCNPDISKGYVPKTIKNADVLHPIANAFHKECAIVIDRIYNDNKALAKKLMKTDANKNPSEELFKIKSRVASYWFQTIENHIVYLVYQFLVGKNIIVPRRCGLEYDGLNIPPSPADFDKNAVIEEVNAMVRKQTGLDIKFKFKAYDQDYVLTNVIDQRRELVGREYDSNMKDIVALTPVNGLKKRVVTPDTYEEVFNQLYPIFEQHHAKIIDKSVYIKEDNDKVIVMSKTALITSYEHMECGYDGKGKAKSFIHLWVNHNNNIRCYKDIDIYPNATLCPADIFNLWRPLAYETFPRPFSCPNNEGKDRILNHIRILCGNEEPVYLYVLKWIAHMLKYPARKSTALTFISAEGAGKGTLLKLLSLLVGSNRVLETTTPSRDVWGSFNGLMSMKYLVNLNEMSKKETLDSLGRIKALITDESLTINEKGVNQYQIKSYHRFIVTTNYGDPIPTSKGDRRNLIMRASDEKCFQKEYFDQLHKDLDDIDVIHTITDTLLAIDVVENFLSLPIPENFYQEDLKSSSRSPHDLWLESFVWRDDLCIRMEGEEVDDITMVRFYAREVFAYYKEWCKDNGFNMEGMNSTKLGVRLNHLFPSHDRKKYINTEHSNGSIKVFNIPALRIYYHRETLQS